MIRRAEMLAELMRFVMASPLPEHTANNNRRDGFQHLREAGLDPTFVNGGLVKAAGFMRVWGRSVPDCRSR
ncbi:hypothetical protein ACNKHM_07325 [Shigella sonnei]